ncbi:MAG: protein kinase [Candidatus Melainabacteria bacterium]|nr:protein kinase [Candidatus Melainabacteria bacterium]
MKNVTGDNKCPRCGGNKNSELSGSITQWVANCACTNFDVPQDDSNADICPTCKKRVNAGRAGSLTQWIFRSDLCSCALPTVEKSRMALAAEAAARTDLEVEKQSTQDVEMQVDPERFPLERYGPLKILGSGMAGTVYLCNDRLLHKKVAIKLLSTLSSEQLVAFQGEARAASKLNHPNVVKVMDFGVTTGGVPFMVMEFVQGNDLAGILQEAGTISVTAALYIFGKVCDGLADAHRLGIFHRDIKNSNILVGALESHKPDVRLIDFGVASFRPVADSKTAQGATLVGTPAYMSPDQALGKQYDASSEVYSIGCALFEALTGSTPFSGETALEVINKHAHEAPPQLNDVNGDVDFSEPLENVVAKCLAKKPSDRYQSMEQLSRALNQIVIGELSESTLPRELDGARVSTVEPATKSSPIFVITIVVFVLLVGIGIWQVMVVDKPTAPSPEEKVSKTAESEIGSSDQSTLVDVHFETKRYNGLNYLISSGSLADENIEEIAKRKDFDAVYILSENITGTGFSAISNVDLKRLDIDNTPLSDDGFEAISKISALKHLSLGDLDISEKQMAMLSSLKKLKTLDLTNSRLSEGALQLLGSFPTIQTLSLSNVQRTKPGDLENLVAAKNLNKLNLAYINYGKQDLTALEKLTSLNSINFTGSDIDDRVFQHLALLPLDTVTLDRTNITGSGFSALGNMRGLKQISLRRCKKVPTQAVVNLELALPGCTIIR